MNVGTVPKFTKKIIKKKEKKSPLTRKEIFY
jgi:hypothetical protein